MTSSTMERIVEAAAEARSAGVAQRSHRPSQRRCMEEPGSRPAGILRAQIQVRAASGDSDRLHFEGFASVYETFYEMWDMFGPYDEQVVSGAGKKTLAREDLDCPLVLQHEALRRIARTTNGTLTLAETEQDGVEGLLVDAPHLNPADPDVAYIAPKLQPDGDRAPLIDEMSFRFRIIRGQWSDDYATYSIEEYDIHRGDVAIVAYGANPYTQGAGLRAGQAVGQMSLDDLTEADLRALENKLHARRKDLGLDQAPTPPRLSRAALAAIDDLERD